MSREIEEKYGKITDRKKNLYPLKCVKKRMWEEECEWKGWGERNRKRRENVRGRGEIEVRKMVEKEKIFKERKEWKKKDIMPSSCHEKWMKNTEW